MKLFTKDEIDEIRKNGISNTAELKGVLNSHELLRKKITIALRGLEDAEKALKEVLKL